MGNQINQPLGVAVVGLGVGEQHAITYSKLSNCNLIFVYDIDTDKANYIANKYSCQVAQNYEQIINDYDVNLISIASFDDCHYPQIIEGLKHSKHIFVEKPMCETSEELKSIKKEWLTHGDKLKLSSNLILRAAPVYQWVKTKIDNGDLGEIFAFDADYLYGRLQKMTHGWRKDLKNYSAMKGGGIHLIDLMIWLLGDTPQSVSTTGNKICTKNTDFQPNDFMASTFHFQSGVVGRVTANLGCIHRHHHTMRIFGTKATFIYDDAGPRIHYTCDPNVRSAIIKIETLPRSKGDLIPPFVQAISENIDLSSHTQEMFDLISICFACESALKVHHDLTIEYI